MNTWSERVYCRDCGAEITYLGPQAIRCTECRIERLPPVCQIPACGCTGEAHP